MRFSRVSAVMLFAAVIAPATAQEADEPHAMVHVGAASRRVFRGVERAGASAQARVEWTQSGWLANFFGNAPFDGAAGREIDLGAGYRWSFAESAGAGALDVSVTQFLFPNAPAGGTKRSWETGLTLTLPAAFAWTPSVAGFHDFRLQADTVQVALGRKIALTGVGAFLHVNFFAGAAGGRNWRPDAAGPHRRDSYYYIGGEATLPFRVGEHASIVAGVHFSQASGRSAVMGPDGRPADANLWFTLGVNLDF